MKYMKKIILMIFLSLTISTTIFAQNNVLANTSEEILMRCHFQNIGWTDWITTNGGVAELYKDGYRLEAVEIATKNLPGSSVKYQSHIQNVGWVGFRKNGEKSGSTGNSLRLEAIKILLENAPSNYSIEYETNLKGIGWSGWKKDGELSGTTGISKEVNGIRVKLVSDNPNVNYSVYTENAWQQVSDEGLESGNSGTMDGISGIYFKLNNGKNNSNIMYNTMDSDSNWSNTAMDGEVSGSLNSGNKISAFKASLVNLDDKKIDYMAQMNDGSWTSWCEDGEICGDQSGENYIVAIKSRIVKPEIQNEKELKQNKNNIKNPKNKLPSNEIPKSTTKASPNLKIDNLPKNSDVIFNKELSREIARLTNELRNQNGLSPLYFDESLESSAIYKSNSMLQLNYFSHSNPQYENKGFEYLMREIFNNTSEAIGENIFTSSNVQETAQSIFNSWANSPGHRANMLNPVFKSIGVSAVYSPSSKADYSLYATQHFSSEEFK